MLTLDGESYQLNPPQVTVNARAAVGRRPKRGSNRTGVASNQTEHLSWSGMSIAVGRETSGAFAPYRDVAGYRLFAGITLTASAHSSSINRSPPSNGGTEHGRARLSPKTRSALVDGEAMRPVVVIRARGYIDVTNAAVMTEYAIAHAHRVSVGCARKRRAFIPTGVEVSRLLRMCDPHGELPAARNIDHRRW